MSLLSGFAGFFLSEETKQRRAEQRIEHELKMQGLERVKVQMSGSAWDVVGKESRITGPEWLTQRMSLNSELESSLGELWNAVENLVKNDPYASSAVSGRVDNVIGTGMTFHSRVKPSSLITEELAREYNQERERLFRLWARCDRFKAKQRLFERTKATFGEAFGLWSDGSMNDDRPIPLTWQIINPRRVSTPSEHEGNELVRFGIRYSDNTFITPVSYFIRNAEQHDSKQYDEMFTEYPAYRVQHSFEQQVPGQLRGFPWLTPAMPTLKDIKDYSEAKLIAEQVGACTSTFIHAENPAAKAAGVGSTLNSAGRRIKQIEPGMVEYIGIDDKVTTLDPNRPGNTFAPFIDHKLLSVAAAIRYPYALLSKNFRNVSHSSGRLEFSDGRQSFECWQDAVREDAILPLVERASFEMAQLGLLPVSFSQYLAIESHYCACQLTPTKWNLLINPKQETEADVADVQAGFASASDKCDARSMDFEDVLASRERELILKAESEARVNKKREELGLMPTGQEAEPEAKTDDSEKTSPKKDDDDSA